MQPWLRNSIVATVVSTIVLSVSWVGICTFWVGPQLFRAVMAGKITHEPRVCDNADDRAVQVLTGLLATLLALTNNNR
jgi:hypothetical protein